MKACDCCGMPIPDDDYVRTKFGDEVFCCDGCRYQWERDTGDERYATRMEI